jgi:hypothetical protein
MHECNNCKFSTLKSLYNAAYVCKNKNGSRVVLYELKLSTANRKSFRAISGVEKYRFADVSETTSVPNIRSSDDASSHALMIGDIWPSVTFDISDCPREFINEEKF